MADLSPPKLYAPWVKGNYDVAPNLRLLGKEKAFEFDSQWPRVRRNKESKASGPGLRHNLDEATAEAAVAELTARLTREWPDLFRLDGDLECALTGERIALDATGLDTLAMNLPCDLAIVRRRGAADWNAYLHVRSPSHWRPEEKIGQPFVATHASIPHFEKVNLGAKGLVDAMVARGPWVRFVWGVESDDALDHHPDRAAARDFKDQPFVIRVERQVSIPLPEHDASIFLIGLSFVDEATVLADEKLWRPLRAALEGMSPEARAYKGIAEGFGTLIERFPR